ncbi:site-specific recombinase XerD [Arcticibacter tournemirensis]|uniref:Tyrosine-type recombinase/integrase n=1 Tax=Arcticibacter tournemirensis TaxID=699437 RepID=A0A5M9GZE2_9SPHI|nr:site-specific integrase [Arcticibacter tournemirensis]KAA8480072.1 tyrosine-type recombinase/integrase [Arcticibacter tournemirensis]TQM50673.1 site-specific recombinase XerD [Arcticibacter tournemirensis]
MNKKIKEISEVIEAYLAELIDRDYYRGTIKDYTRGCRAIQKWWDKNDLKEFNEENAARFCDEVIGTRYLTPTLTSEQKKRLRVVRMLLSVYHNEDFENYTPPVEKNLKTELGEVFSKYIEWCTLSLKLAPNTLDTHKRVAFKYDTFLNEKGLHFEKVSTSNFEDFIACQSKSNRMRFKAVLRNIYRFLHNSEITKGDLSTLILKEPHIHQGSKLPTTYTEEEIKKLLLSVDRSTAGGKRDYLILLLAAEYGMRASDIRSLSLKHIDWETNTISFNQQKTDIPISYPLIPSVGNAIIDYLKHGRPPEGDAVIIVRHDSKRKGAQLTSSGIYSIVESAFRATNIVNWKEKKHGPHSLRHSFASNLLKRGTGYYVISMAMGHSCSETTKAYLQIDFERLRKCSLPIPDLHSLYYNNIGKEVRNEQAYL